MEMGSGREGGREKGLKFSNPATGSRQVENLEWRVGRRGRGGEGSNRREHAILPGTGGLRFGIEPNGEDPYWLQEQRPPRLGATGDGAKSKEASGDTL